MFRAVWGTIDWIARGEAMRRVHSAWLTRALQRGSRPPRIPTRKVDEGGWNTLMDTPEGRAWAQDFWDETLEHPEAR